MQEFFYNILTGIGIMDIIDIAIVAYLIYRILMFIRSTRAEQLLKGLIVLVVITLASGLLNLHTLNWILRGIMTLGAVALVVVFQQELRRGLEYLGRTKFLKGSGMDKDKAKHITHEFIRAIETFSKDRTGALIVLERDTALSEMTESGTIINAEISAELLGNLFYEGSPLHDGAIIIRGDRIVSATCYLPLSDNMGLSKDLGTRHRAAVGMSEVSDALVIAVSEETGAVSVAQGGVLYRNLKREELREKLTNIQDKKTEASKLSALTTFLKGRLGDEGKTDK